MSETSMRGLRPRLLEMIVVAAMTSVVPSLARAQQVEFVAASAALEHAARAYEAIWNEHGARIVAALETHTCLPFVEPRVAATVADGVSHSGGPEHPMQLRASYAHEVKQATLVHELGHRHLWQLAERLDEIDGHKTLYLVLERVWADVWGVEFAEDRVLGESSWDAHYDYAAAWTWARSLDPAERMRLWNQLLARNGFPAECIWSVDGGGAEQSDLTGRNR